MQVETATSGKASKAAAKTPNFEPSWMKVMGDEFSKPYMVELRKFIAAELDAGRKLHPKPSEYFAAFWATPFDQVRVVILGQDPYHGEGQAHGLCFSVKKGVRFPPSLLNIYKELESDLGIPRPQHGCLTSWTEQGVLLLNSVLTVRDGQAAAHQGKGWEKFTDRAVKELNDRREGIVFLLWGSYAIKKGAIIDRKKHFVLESVHPSPLSASRGFFGSKPFSKINRYLKSRGEKEIDWRVP